MIELLWQVILGHLNKVICSLLDFGNIVFHQLVYLFISGQDMGWFRNRKVWPAVLQFHCLPKI